MIRSALAMICFLLLLSAPTTVAADGNEYLSRCNNVIRSMDDKSDTVDHGKIMSCLGFVQAFTQATIIFTNMGYELPVCLPTDGIVNSQAVRIFVGFMEDNPELLHLEEMFLLIAAFMTAFPCD
ncbi:MAG: hypothetical protein IIA60_07505 [Candidatus Marinimicrobia bacterium]|nr:hypothetical protein [Candidatus Neomarinimicrobiota bacterium]